ASIDNVVAQYIKQCGNGRLPSIEEINTQLDAFNAALKANGLDDVIAAAQEQLDQYAKDNNIA
ncbi:MAG: hypothetical protein GX929_06415, partial [Clostridiales bacterium]|nr:hypothetical protein [Clostridiales bacterium]